MDGINILLLCIFLVSIGGALYTANRIMKGEEKKK